MEIKDNFELFLHGIEGPQKEIFDWGNYRIGTFIIQNKERGYSNQDSLFLSIKENFCLFGIADGAGGHKNGAEASYIIGETLLQYVRTAKPSETQIIHLIEEANQNVREKLSESFSTLAFGVLFQNELRSYSIGDSEIQYYNHQGENFYSNIPQSPVGHAIEAGVMSQQEGLDHPERNLVNNLVGDEHLRIEVATNTHLKKGYSVIIGSDGLFDNVPHEELLKTIGSGSFDEGFNQLCDLCENRSWDWRKDDDISFIFLKRMRSN